MAQMEDNNTNTETTLYKAFESKNDYDTLIQSTSSKAKNEVFKATKFNSIDEINNMKTAYDKLVKVDSDNKKNNLTDLENVQNDLQLSQSALNIEKSTNVELIKKFQHQENLNIVLQVENLNKDYANDVMVLANAMVTDDMDFKTAVSKVIERHPNLTGKHDQSFGFGTDSNSKDEKPSTLQELYDEAKKNGKLKDQIKIKQDAFKKGILVT